jgi:hypothetical protein
VHAAGGEVTIVEQDNLSITATRAVQPPKYATPTGK